MINTIVLEAQVAGNPYNAVTKIRKITNRKLIKLLNLYLSIPGQEKSMRTSNISFCVQIIILLSQIFRMDVETFLSCYILNCLKTYFI